MLENLTTLETLTAVGSAFDMAKVRLTAISGIDHLGTDIVSIHTPVGDHDQLAAIVAEYGELVVVSVIDRKRKKVCIIEMTGEFGGLRAAGILAILPIHARADLIDLIKTTRTAVDWHHAARAA
ncbi:hypothetical protein U5903_04265 [Cereibacter johrii]|uniref:hypothetical protein n=1 Tax=Cereibacter johrii TaxID=445629 RepID=UPI002B260A7C|nr:hypothetical protein [Cereibacter johrii]MEA5159983.1 hypothetical protein [Cereibacter johrii]